MYAIINYYIHFTSFIVKHIFITHSVYTYLHETVSLHGRYVNVTFETFHFIFNYYITLFNHLVLHAYKMKVNRKNDDNFVTDAPPLRASSDGDGKLDDSV